MAAISWVVLAIQFYLYLTNPDIQNISAAERIVRFFSFFTTLTNLLVAITWTVIVVFPQAGLSKFFSKTTTQTAVAVYISIVGIVYSLLLRSVWNPDGWQKIADHWLHDAIPLLFIAYWIFFVPRSGIGWLDPIKWLIYPVVYIVYSLIRGALVNWYPYYFVDVDKLGYPIALQNTALMLVAFLTVGFVFVGIDKLVSRTAKPAMN
jgi:hypothetical protein